MLNILIQTGPGIGDMLQKLPMASAIKSQYPDVNIDFITSCSPQNFKTISQVIECQNYVRSLYWYRVDYKLHCAALLLKLRMNHYDIGFVRDGGMITTSSKPSMWIFRIMRLAGVKKLVGYIRDRVDIFVDVPEFTHLIERDRLTLNAAGINAPMTFETIDRSKLDFTFENYERLKNSKARKVIALSVGTNEYHWFVNGKGIAYDVKSWDYKKWIELAVRLAEEGFSVILLGGKRERERMSEKNLAVPENENENENIFDFIGKTSIKQSLALLSLCSLVVGSDGGMMHCASGLGVKTLTIFGGSDYRLWTPAGGEILTLGLECSPCFGSLRAVECQYHRCLEEISVEMVFNRIMKIVSRSGE